MVNPIDLDQYPTLREKEPHFKELVSQFIPRLSSLSEAEKDKLALFKAIELINALIQIREQKNAPNRLGKEKAAKFFKIVRAAIRDQQIVFPDQETVSLKDPPLREIIDEASRTFHAGKQDQKEWEKAMALSTAQYIVLNQYLPTRLAQVHQYYHEWYPEEIIQEVKEGFIIPYQLS